MNLLNYIVPLSMYVTIELQRFVGSQFIEWDEQLYDKKTDQPAKANTSDLNEDLGQVEYLFSDKTGTLTENEMVFKQFSINGITYEERKGKVYKLNSNVPLDLKNDLDKNIEKLFEVLSLCHTVQVDETKEEKYQASSPDEFSFIEFCSKIGIVFQGDKQVRKGENKLRICQFLGEKRSYEILQILDFDSTRKRMSIILRDLQSRQIVVYCKGADNAVFKKCISGDVDSCNSAITSFSKKGWRTLALSYKYITPDEYARYEDILLDAFNDIANRNEKMALAFEEIESNLILVGSTAVEDKLQDDVANTLERLRMSGIKIWVLTGDKIETAINISNSCKHFSNSMHKLRMTDLKETNEILKAIDNFRNIMSQRPSDSYAIIIDGGTLGFLFKADLQEQFRDICMKCEAVLCCRMSPAQKAEVVKLVKLSSKKPVTAAIGDGANDVSMIQEAHIGLGIFGKEGRNAARSADFAFAKFKFLQRILLVHGYLYYTRSSYLVQYFFYKNTAFVFSQVYFAFWNAFSITSLFNSIVLTFYNITLTAAPILLYGLFEQKVPIDKISKNPNLYKAITRNNLLTPLEFLKWNMLGFWHSIITYFFSFFMFYSNNSFQSDGKLSGNLEFGSLVIVVVILVVHLKLFMEWTYQTWFTLIGFGLSVLGFVVCCLIPNAFIMPPILQPITEDQNLFWVFFHLFGSASVWFCIILTTVTSLIPDLVVKITEQLYQKIKYKRKMTKRNSLKRNSLTTKKSSLYTDNIHQRLADTRPKSSMKRPEINQTYVNDEDINPTRLYQTIQIKKEDNIILKTYV